MGMGYQGFVKFYTGPGPTDAPAIILATGASVNLVLEPIYSAAVWGAGWYNAGVAHYADAAIRYEGSVDFEMQASATVWDFIQKWISNERAYPKSLDISPDGARVYQYRATNYPPTLTVLDTFGAWNTSASFSTSEGSFVTCSAGVVAFRRNEKDPAGGSAYSNYAYLQQKQGVIGSSCSLFSTTNPLNPSTLIPGAPDNLNPIPFWKTNAVLCKGTYSTPFDISQVADVGLETVEWSLDIAQNNVILYTCSGQRLPTAFLQGPMDATGSIILFNQNGVFDPILGPAGTGTLTTPYLYAEVTWFVVQISHGSGNVYMELPAVVVESDDYAIPGPDSVVNRTFSLKGLAGRCNGAVTMPPFIMSDSTGVFAAP